MGEAQTVDHEHPDGGSQRTGKVIRHVEVAEALSPVALRTDIGGIGVGGRQEERVSRPLEDSYDEKGEEGGGYKIGDGGEGEEDGAGDHEGLLVMSQKGSSDKGFQNQRSEEEDPDEDADFRLRRS